VKKLRIQDLTPLPRLLIAGASTRAAAESAARAGVEVTALDAYADIDQHPSVRALQIPRASGVRTSADALAEAAAGIDADAVVYLSPFENHPHALTALVRGRRLLGNSVDVLRRVRDPLVVQRELQRRGFDVPRVTVSRSRRDGDPASVASAAADAARSWLLKPLASGGGHGIRPCDASITVRAGWYVQERIDGWPGSVTFVAAGGRCRVLAVTRQVVGDPAFGASAYRYCGSLMTAADPSDHVNERLSSAAGALAAAVTETFDLVGVNGIDFIARHDVPVPVEINPRWTSSMELVDRLSSTPVMGSHIEACHGSLGAGPPLHGASRVTGKAIVFARTDVMTPDTREWLNDSCVRDVPAPRQRITGGQPVCTVFAEGPTVDACYTALVRRAGDVYGWLR